MRVSDWRDLAVVYDEPQGGEGDFWRRTYLDPALFARIGDVTRLRVLDLACGNGHNTRRIPVRSRDTSVRRAQPNSC